MPLYEFRCGQCRALRDVTASFAQADSLELVCGQCGGTMRKTFSASVSVGISSAASPCPAPAGRAGRRRARTCNDGAVKLSRPNPFRDEVRAGRPGQDRP